MYRLREAVAHKLGVCPRCMRMSLVGTVLFWCIALLVAVAGGSSLVLYPVTLVAAAFSLLLIAHCVVFLFRAVRSLREPIASTIATNAGDNDEPVDRSQFLLSVGKMALIGLGASLFGTSVAWGQTSRGGIATATFPCNCGPGQTEDPCECPCCEVVDGILYCCNKRGKLLFSDAPSENSSGPCTCPCCKVVHGYLVCCGKDGVIRFSAAGRGPDPGPIPQ